MIRFFHRTGIALAILAVLTVVVTVVVVHVRSSSESERVVAHVECALALAADRSDGSCRDLSVDDMESARRLAACFRARNHAQRSGQDPDSACELTVAPASTFGRR
jgi:hypothetical protein